MEKTLTQEVAEQNQTLLEVQILIADKQNRIRAYVDAIGTLNDEIQSLQNTEQVVIEELVILERALAKQQTQGINLN